MKKILFITTVIVLAILLQSCEQDDLSTPGGNKEVESTFKTMYADATFAEWEKEGGYWKVDFWHNGKEREAWFTTKGAWYQTETDLAFSELPDAVVTAYESGEYKDWRVDDVDMFERKDAETFYVLDVEKGNQEYDLHYSPNGTLINSVKGR